MRKRNTAAVLLVVMITATAVFLAGCGSGQPGTPDDTPSDTTSETGEYVPGIHEAYGISYAVPDTNWIYMFNAEQLGTGDEFIDMEIACGEAENGLEAVWKAARKEEYSGSRSVDGRECYWYDINSSDGWSKYLLIPQSEENKYIEIRSDFIETADKEKADAFYEEILNGIKFTDYKGYKACKEYIEAGGVRIPSYGMKPVQFFYGLMDDAETDGMVSAQIDFDEESYEKGPEQTFAEMSWEDVRLIGDGKIEIDGIEGKWYTWLDELPDSMPYMSHVIMIPNDETQTLMNIDYDFNADVGDVSIYDDRIKELDSQIHVAGKN